MTTIENIHNTFTDNYEVTLNSNFTISLGETLTIPLYLLGYSKCPNPIHKIFLKQ